MAKGGKEAAVVARGKREEGSVGGEATNQRREARGTKEGVGGVGGICYGCLIVLKDWELVNDALSILLVDLRPELLFGPQNLYITH